MLLHMQTDEKIQIGDSPYIKTEADVRFYMDFGLPKDNGNHPGADAFPFSADDNFKMYGSRKAVVKYTPGCLNGASWCISTLNSRGGESLGLNIFHSVEDAKGWCEKNGYEYSVKGEDEYKTDCEKF